MIASLLTGSVPLLLLIGVGFILWALMGTPLSTLQATRYMLAWSLDRTVPHQLGDVNDKRHTPVKAIVLCAITGVIALVCLVQIPQASLLGALLAQICAFIVVSIAGIVFPYRLPQIWEGGGGRRILGIPAVTLAGIGGVISLGGPDDHVHRRRHGERDVRRYPRAVAEVHDRRRRRRRGLVPRRLAVNRSRGIDLSLAYREIPPE